jgi:hypothetical protein
MMAYWNAMGKTDAFSGVSLNSPQGSKKLE